MIRAQTKLEFAWGTGDAHGRGDQRQPTADAADAGRDLDIRRVHPRRDPFRRARRVRVWQRRVVAGRAAAGGVARDAADVVPARERDYPPDRLAQPFHRAHRRRNSPTRAASAARTNISTAPARSKPKSAPASSAWPGISPAARSPAATSNTSGSISARAAATSWSRRCSRTATVPTGWSTVLCARKSERHRPVAKRPRRS